MKNESNRNADGADNTQKPKEDRTPPSSQGQDGEQPQSHVGGLKPENHATTPAPESGEGDDHHPGDPNKVPPMRSQSELNLPPVEPWPEPVNGQNLLE